MQGKMRQKFACGPCRKRKSKCEHVMVCSACIMHNTQDSCYSDMGASSSSSPFGASYERTRKTGQIVAQDTRQIISSINPFLLPYLERLPALLDCWLAFECFFNDLQSFGNLPYVDREHLNTLISRLPSAEISLVELSYIYSLLALAGISAPCPHPLSRISCISSNLGHKRNLDLAIELLILSQDDGVFDEVDMEETMTRCICQTVISGYWIQDGKIDQAWYYSEMANLNAKAIHLYDDEDASLGVMTSSLFYRRDMLRTDLLFNGRFSSFILNKETSVPGIDRAIVCKPRRPDGTIDHFKTHLLQMKTSGPLIGLQITDFISHFNDYTDPEERKRHALKLDRQLTSFVNSQSIEMLALPRIDNVALEDSYSAMCADRKLSVAVSLQLMRMILAMPFLVGTSQDPILQRNGFRAARGLLASFGLINHMLRSPWVSTFSKLYSGAMIEKAMTVFVIGMEAIQSVETTSSISTRRSPDSISDISWFLDQFPRLYHTLTSTGLGGPSAFQAAKILLRLPIPMQLTPFPTVSTHNSPAFNTIESQSLVPQDQQEQDYDTISLAMETLNSTPLDSGKVASMTAFEEARSSFENSLRLLLLPDERKVSKDLPPMPVPLASHFYSDNTTTPPMEVIGREW